MNHRTGQTTRSWANLSQADTHLLGFSNGAGFAPLVAGSNPVRGYMVFSGWYKTWLEHMLEHERRRLRLSGVAAPEITRRMQQYATFYCLYLNGKMTPGQIIAQHSEFKSIWYDEAEHQYGRQATLYHQLQDLNLAMPGIVSALQFLLCMGNLIG